MLSFRAANIVSLCLILPHITWDKQTFPGFEDKWDAFPSWVVDPQRGRCECRTGRVGRNGFVIEIPGLAVRGDILAKKGIMLFDGRDRAEDFDLDVRVSFQFQWGKKASNLFIPNILRGERDRSLHSQNT